MSYNKLDKYCKFCSTSLNIISEHAGQFDIYTCRGCLYPKYNTLHRALYYKAEAALLVDSFKLDDYFIVRYHSSGKFTAPHTVIYKNVIGLLENGPNMEPMTFNKPVCDVNYIIHLPWHDLELAKKKLNVWATFS